MHTGLYQIRRLDKDGALHSGMYSHSEICKTPEIAKSLANAVKLSEGERRALCEVDPLSDVLVVLEILD